MSTPTNFQDPDVSKTTPIHSTIDQQPVSHGYGSVALTGGGCGAVKTRTLPLETSPLSNLQIAQIIEVPE